MTIAVSALVAAAASVGRWRELGWVLGEQPAALPPAVAVLARHKTVVLTSYRADGRPVITPVSIVAVGGRLCVRSFERAGKVRRIRNNPNVCVAPSTGRGRPTGSPLHATARLLTGAQARLAGRALRRKYPLLHGVLVPAVHRIGRARTGRTVHLELVPQDAALRPGGSWARIGAGF